MNNLLQNKKLLKNFYEKETKQVAKELLGKILVRRISNKLLAGIIVETEAYFSKNDEASHSYNGISKRNKTMFKESGFLYVYQIYGIHFCCNVVTGKENVGEAVLIRALEPIENIEIMAHSRFGEAQISKSRFRNLTNGPAKLCKAFSISKKDDGINLLDDDIYILNSKTISETNIKTTTRIGITKSEELQLRFFIKNNSFISKQ
jgi:DNA-3-methyladenine glycosylase